MVDIYLASILIFALLMAVLMYKDRKNIEVKYVLFTRRTTRFREYIDSIARTSPTIWKVFGTIGIFICLYYMIFGVAMIASTANQVYLGLKSEPALQFILPSPTTSPVSMPGVIGIPFWFWIITIFVILLPHELFHGVLARVHKIKLESVGVFLLAIIPGAFVEPNEKQLKRAKFWDKMRVYAAGSFMNIVVAFNILFITQFFLWGAIVQPGIIITSIDQTSPASLAGITNGTVLYSIDNNVLGLTFADYSYSIFSLPNSTTQDITRTLSAVLLYHNLKSYQPGDVVQLNTDKGEYNITLGENPNIAGLAYIGVGGYLNTQNQGLFNNILPLLALISVLSLAVAIVNLLPLYPLDGGLMMEAISEKISKKWASQMVKAITWIIIFILIYDFVGPLI